MGTHLGAKSGANLAYPHRPPLPELPKKKRDKKDPRISPMKCLPSAKEQYGVGEKGGERLRSFGANRCVTGPSIDCPRCGIFKIKLGRKGRLEGNLEQLWRGNMAISSPGAYTALLFLELHSGAKIKKEAFTQGERRLVEREAYPSEDFSPDVNLDKEEGRTDP